MEQAKHLLKHWRWWILGGFAVAVLVGGVFMVPAARVKAAEVVKTVLGTEEPAVTIVTQEQSGPLQERLDGLEATVKELQQARTADAAVMTQLRADYQQAIHEVAATHDALVASVEAQSKTVVASSSTKIGSTPAAPEAGATTSATPAPVVSGKISINKASVTELDGLPGIGPSYAQRIVDYRKEHGPFKSIDELDGVKGIGPAIIEKIRDLVTL